MLTATNESLWIEHLINFFHYGKTINGVPLTAENKKAYIPYMEYIADDAIKSISKAGYIVKKASPAKSANYALRIFRHECIRDSGSSYWVYGVKAYERTHKDNFIDSSGNLLDENNFLLCLTSKDGTSTLMQPHFADYYLEIRKVLDDIHGIYSH